MKNFTLRGSAALACKPNVVDRASPLELIVAACLSPQTSASPFRIDHLAMRVENPRFFFCCHQESLTVVDKSD